MLVGKTRSGKTSTVNTLLRRHGSTRTSASSQSTKCLVHRGEFCGQKLVIIDTPGGCNTKRGKEELRTEMAKCITYAAPGPHVFLYVMKPDPLTNEDFTFKEIIERIFGKEAKRYTLVLYTRGDKKKKIPEDSDHKKFREDFDTRVLSFNNKDESESSNQVPKLLSMINSMVGEDNRFYTNAMFERAQQALEREREREGMTSADAPTEDVLDRTVNVLLEVTMGEPWASTVKDVVGLAAGKVGSCIQQ